MLKYLIIQFIGLLFYQTVFTQTNNYFPLTLGNEYQFHGDTGKYFWGKIEKDTVYPNGKLYFSLTAGTFEFGDCRVDSNGNILSISKAFFGGDPEENLLFKADAKVNEVWPVAWNFNPVIDTGYARCIWDDSLNVFGKLRNVKGVLIFDASYYYYYFWLAEGIGLIRDQYDDGSTSNLNYARINGIEYGTLVSVDEDIPIVTEEFYVSQNYPNPFNGTTNIIVRIPDSPNEQTAKLTIYNLLGNKVYDKEYTGDRILTIRINTNELNLSSGTYFYSVFNGNRRIMKKFILLK